MRRLDISKFRNNIKEELKDLPIALTRYESIVAVVDNFDDRRRTEESDHRGSQEAT